VNSCEDYYRAGGVPAIVSETHAGGSHRGIGADGEREVHRRNCRAAASRMSGHPAFRPASEGKGRLLGPAGQSVRMAIMKTSVIGEDFRARYLSNPMTGTPSRDGAVVFDGRRTTMPRIDDPALQIDDRTILFMRGAGQSVIRARRKWSTLRAPAYLIREDCTICRVWVMAASGTSGLASILNASPEAAIGGGPALLRTDDRVRIDLRRGEATCS